VLQLREQWKAIQKDRVKVENWHQHSEKRIAKYQEELKREQEEIAADGKPVHLFCISYRLTVFRGIAERN
jgi:SMC interacting uncharacterized protein involved in chromosome segregation